MMCESLPTKPSHELIQLKSVLRGKDEFEDLISRAEAEPIVDEVEDLSLRWEAGFFGKDEAKELDPVRYDLLEFYRVMDNQHAKIQSAELLASIRGLFS